MLRQLLELEPDALDQALPPAWRAAPAAAVARLCADVELLAMRTSAAAEADPPLDAGVLAQLFEQGLFSLTVPRAHGGLEASLRDFVLAMESVGRMGPAYAMTAVPHLCISVKAVASLCPAAKAAPILGAIRARRQLLAFAITEDQGSDLAALTTRLSDDPGRGWRLNGRKQWITNLQRASHVVVAALYPGMQPGATALLLVGLEQEGVSRSRPWAKLCANGSDTSDLYFDDVAIEPDQLLGAPGQGMALFNEMVLSGRLGAAAAAVGLARQALQVARASPLLARDQAAIGATLDALSATLSLSAALGDAGHPEFAQVTALAKHACSRAAQDCVDRIEHAYLCAGASVPPAVTRAARAMGLFRLLKGPGEILGLHALSSWAARMDRAPAQHWPRRMRLALARLARGFADINAAGGLSANPVRAMLLAELAGACWCWFAAATAQRNATTPTDGQAAAWAWRTFTVAARRMRKARPVMIEQIDDAYALLRHTDFARLSVTEGAWAC
ncbi:alkylation response protein AidB-like acyl-CoA dehydrogenase [Oxalobacteraceae bacterium GrIS 1.11]